jgi:uncharacterized membrane protein
MLYPMLVFLHVLGAMGVFAAFAIESVALRNLRSDETGRDVRASLKLFTLASRMGMVSMILLLGAGIALMVTVWHRQAWISAAFVGIVMMAAVGGAVTARRLRSLRTSLAATTASEPSSGVRQPLLGAGLSTALVVRIAIAVGIVGLMTAKPDLAGSALILAGATVAGIVVSVPIGSRRPSSPRRA